MPGNRRVTFDLSPRQYSPPLLDEHPSLVVLPSPGLSVDELISQISTLRTELRDGRLLQARQRSQLNQETACITELTRKYKEVKQERRELKTKLGQERVTAAATQKRLNVAVKNHAEAQDKCARTMVECERLRILNEQLTLLNNDLGASKSEAEADFEEKIAEMECVFQDKLEEAEAAFMREREESREKHTSQRIEEQKALKKELDSRDAKIKKLERDLNRQCEINAMFTLNYDRDTNFTKHLSMPLAIPTPEENANGLSSGLLRPTSQSSALRRPLIHLDGNSVTTRKRSRPPSWRGDKDDIPPSGTSKSSPDKDPASKSPAHDDQDSSHKRSRFNHPSALANKDRLLQRPQSSLRSSLGLGGCH